MKFLLMALLLSGCSAGVSSRCGYSWTGQLICETRFHHAGKPSTFAAYAVEDGKVVSLSAEESSSVYAPLESLGSFVP